MSVSGRAGVFLSCRNLTSRRATLVSVRNLETDQTLPDTNDLVIQMGASLQVAALRHQHFYLGS